MSYGPSPAPPGTLLYGWFRPHGSRHWERLPGGGEDQNWLWRALVTHVRRMGHGDAVELRVLPEDVHPLDPDAQQ